MSWTYYSNDEDGKWTAKIQFDTYDTQKELDKAISDFCKWHLKRYEDD